MTPTWQSEDTPALPKLGLIGVVRAVLRGILIVLVLFLGVGLTLLFRLIEVLLFGKTRPYSGAVTVAVCRAALSIMRLQLVQSGTPMQNPGVLVANHSSWLDIFTLNAGGALYFVSKAEVATWPGIGFLARLTGTVFVRREAREAGRQKSDFEQRLKAGHRLLFFPEGTSTDNLQVLAFKPTLFAALFADGLRDRMWVQPVSVAYQAPDGRDTRFYGWWGDMDLGPHLLRMLAQSPQGRVHVTWHPPLRVSDFEHRKTLAKAAEDAVRKGHADSRGRVSS